MPLYLVRWPGLEAALVSAADEDELLQHLDEIENPEGCTWSVYRGPVFVEFALNADVEIKDANEPRERPLQPDEVRLVDVSRICRRDVMSTSVPLDADAGFRMVETILRKAFPELHKVVDTPGETVPENAVQDALRRELDKLVKASWQHQQTKRRDDPESRIAAVMGTSPRLVGHWSKKMKTEPAPPKRRAPRGKSRSSKPKRK